MSSTPNGEAHAAEKHTAHIESLTAQVRVLMVGNRQITLVLAGLR